MSEYAYDKLRNRIEKEHPPRDHKELADGSQAIFGVKNGGAVYALAIHGESIENVARKMKMTESEVNITASHILQFIPN